MTMTSTGLVIPPGGGRRVITPSQGVTFKVTGEHAVTTSTFEVQVPPGFDVGAHAHARCEELFYVLDGEVDLLAFQPREIIGDCWQEWESAAGERAVRAGPGTLAVVPIGCPHAFANPTKQPARMLLQSSPPPDHERYFEELMEIFEAGLPVDAVAVEELRRRYDVQQFTPMRAPMFDVMRASHDGGG